MTESIAVIGGGTMGTGIAYVFAAAGARTIVVEPDTARMGVVRGELERAAAAGVHRGKFDEATAAALLASIEHRCEIEELPSGLHLVIESVPETVGLKRRVLAAAERTDPAVLATNTSALSIDELARGLENPDRFLGMHFFNPVWSIPVVEVVRGSATSADTMATVLDAVSRIGKESAVVRDMPGFATSRLDVVAALEAIRMVEAGVGEPPDIDRAIELAYRHPMGPLRLTDIVGLDVRLDIARHLEYELGPQFAPPRLLIDKVAAGELGRKAGQGFYEWNN